MKIRKQYLFLILLLIFTLFLTSCEHVGNQEEEHQGREVTLYYLNVDEDDLTPVKYRLFQADDPEKESQEIIGLLSSKDEADKEGCKIVVLEEIGVNKISVENGNEVIDFGAGYDQMSAVEESMMRMAVVRSVCQVRGVESVTFTVNGESIHNTLGDKVENMTPENTLLSDEYDTIFSNSREVTLYYSDPKGSLLVPCKQEVEAKDNSPMIEAVLYSLMKAPKGEEGLLSPLPEGLKINRAQIVGNICYVDLSSEIQNLVADVEEEVTVYSMVNSIVSLNENYIVQFTVDGERLNVMNGFKDFDQALSFNKELVREDSN